jgi:hypothetical protein
MWLVEVWDRGQSPRIRRDGNILARHHLVHADLDVGIFLVQHGFQTVRAYFRVLVVTVQLALHLPKGLNFSLELPAGNFFCIVCKISLSPFPSVRYRHYVTHHARLCNKAQVFEHKLQYLREHPNTLELM